MPRARPSRWLRLLLAVVTLVVNDSGVARAVLNVPCARLGAPDLPGGRATTSNGSAGVAPEGVERPTSFAELGHVEAHRPASANPVLAMPCVTSVTAIVSPVEIPATIVVSSARLHPVGPEARLSSHTPSTPFRPPRAI